MCSTQGIQTSLWMGCPIRNLKAHRSYAAPLERFAGLRVLHRLGVPRHPPRTLSRLSASPPGLLRVSERTSRVASAALCLPLLLHALLSAKLKLSFTLRLFRYRLLKEELLQQLKCGKPPEHTPHQTPSPVCLTPSPEREGPTWDTLLPKKQRDSLERR